MQPPLTGAYKTMLLRATKDTTKERKYNLVNRKNVQIQRLPQNSTITA